MLNEGVSESKNKSKLTSAQGPITIQQPWSDRHKIQPLHLRQTSSSLMSPRRIPTPAFHLLLLPFLDLILLAPFDHLIKRR